MAAPNPTCPSFKKWNGVSQRNNLRFQEETKRPVFAPKFNVYVPQDLQDLLQTRPRQFSPDNLEEAMIALKASDPKQWLPATQAIRKALSKGSNPPIQEVVDMGVLPNLVYMMSLADMPQLQVEAAWAVCNVASGTSAQCSAVVEAGALPPAMKLLAAPDSNLREQAAWLLANVAGDGAALRDKCLEGGLLPLLLEAVAKEECVKPLRQLAWLLLNVTRFKPRSREVLLLTLPTVASVVTNSSDGETLADALSALAHIADDCTNEVVNGARQAVERAARLINDPDTSDKDILPAAKVLSALCAGDDAVTQMVIDMGVVSAGYKQLLEGTVSLRLLREVCFALFNIAAGSQDQAMVLLEAGLLPLIIKAYKRSPSTMNEPASVLAIMANKGLPDLANAVREAGGSGPLAEYLSRNIADSQWSDLAAKAVAAEALLAMAQAGAVASSAAGSNEEDDGAPTTTVAVNPTITEYAATGVYQTLQSILERGLLTGKALQHIRRLLDEFPPPPQQK